MVLLSVPITYLQPQDLHFHETGGFGTDKQFGIYASHIGANVGAGNPDDPGIADFIDEHLQTSSATPDAIPLQCYPNPVSGDMYLSFTHKETRTISIWLTDMTGRRIRLVNRRFDAGLHRQHIRPADLALPEGIYLLVLTDGKDTVSGKIVLDL
jgi:hypothetical protein